ncbi:MAG: hypothetical protein ACLFNN_01685 [Candidatus Paceibacterota bacterium]
MTEPNKKTEEIQNQDLGEKAEGERESSGNIKNKKPPHKTSWWNSTMMVALGLLLLMSGLTVYILISVFQEEPPEKRGVEFPFDKEVIIEFSSLNEVDQKIENIARRQNDSEFLEVVFQDYNRPLFITEMLDELEDPVLSDDLKREMVGFSIGTHQGNTFLLLEFESKAFPILSQRSDTIFNALKYFTGRTSREERERLERANTLVVERSGDTTYGFLNDHVIAVTTTEDMFLKILEEYRASLSKF